MGITATTTTRRIGTVLIATWMALAAWSVGLAPAAAQEGPTPPEDLQEAETERIAYYQAPTSQILPATLVSEFPPGVVCVVRPEVCPEDLEPIYTPVEDALTTGLQTQSETEPEGAAPVPPDTLPVSATGGKPDYRSAVQFVLPSVPDGDQVDEFKVYLTETDPTYSVSSPAFRQAVLAMLTCARECDQEQFEKIGDSQPAEQEYLDVEICPIVDDTTTDERSAEWEEGAAQSAAKLPEADCLFGANGARIDLGDAGALWEFDLTFTLQGLVDGEFPYRGFVVRPANLPNLAFGDPDTTFNKQVVFEPTVAYTIATSEAPAGEMTLDLGGDAGLGGGGSEGFAASGGSSGGFSSPSGGVSSSTDAFSAPGGQTSDEAAAAPEVADPSAPVEEGAAAPVAGTEDPTLAAGAPGEATASAWWLWALVPVFLGGMYLTSQSLLAAPVVAPPERAGAMTRLIEKRRQAATAAGPELVQF